MGYEYLINKFEPVDIIAIIVIIGAFVLMSVTNNEIVGTILTSICFYYFGKKGRAPKEDIKKEV